MANGAVQIGILINGALAHDCQTKATEHRLDSREELSEGYTASPRRLEKLDTPYMTEKVPHVPHALCVCLLC